MNAVRWRRRSIRELLRIGSSHDFHAFLMRDAINRYKRECDQAGRSLGTVLALCATGLEAKILVEFAFESIQLTGISEPSDDFQSLLAMDSRLSYQLQNAENVTVPSRSYDLVFVKEGLHHLARPVAALYEMLRLCRRSVIFIEGYDSAVIRALQKIGLASKYETNQEGNISGRDNYVYRWSSSQLRHILNSYYLESGYTLELTVVWLSSKLNGHRLRHIRFAAALGGWLAGLIPGVAGNYLTVFIRPGRNLPSDPDPVL